MKAFDIDVDRWLFCFTHPDDELSLLAWMRRLAEAGRVVHVGWTTSTDRREREARDVMRIIGVPQKNLHFGSVPDRGVCEHLIDAVRFWQGALAQAQPQRIVAGAFECGHLDHDSTNFAVAEANIAGIPMFETPLYHAYCMAVPVLNRFADPSREEVLPLSEADRAVKKRAARMYPSQRILWNLWWYSVWTALRGAPAGLERAERLRMQTHFDYTTPNLPEPLRSRVLNTKKFQRFRSAVQAYDK